jgi:esterase/lipase
VNSRHRQSGILRNSVGLSILDEKQVEAWARALATRWRGSDESWEQFEAYVRDMVAIIDVPALVAQARQAATVAAADAAVRYVQAHARVTAAGLRAAILDQPDVEPARRLAAAAE